MIRFDNVSKTFADGTSAVADLSLSIEAGETVVLVGPSGCGKTTTLRMINRLEEATHGRITVQGRDVAATEPTRLRRGIGYVIQHVGLMPHRTVRENVATVPRLLGWRRARVRERVDEMLATVGLDPVVAERYPHQLSGGQQQRVGVARALAADPAILLMDEPFAAVDPIVRERLQREFLDLKRKVQKTIVFVTHDIDEAIKLGDRIALFKTGGVLAQVARPAELLAHPADDFVAEMLGRERTLKRMSLIRVAQLPVTHTASAPDTAGEAVAQHAAGHNGWVPVVDGGERLMGWCDGSALDPGEHAADHLVAAGGTTVHPDDSMRTALERALSSDMHMVAVVDGEHRFRGTLTLDQIAEAGRWS